MLTAPTGTPARGPAARDLAIDKTGGYLYSRLLLTAISSLATFLVLVALGVPFAVPLALWVGIISQFVPVVGTYIALALPVLVALTHRPVAAVVLLAFEVLYQQFENHVLSPKLTARTMALHPAVVFGAVIAGGLLYGAIGAFLALPAAAILQAALSTYLNPSRDHGLRAHPRAAPALSRDAKAAHDHAPLARP